ncbi:MAG TPA: protein phosphatase 2C domain-containing protein, partial [Bryobacteraceae bacterium]|nr:protein phosphatase 2C domain-containing protein [Bryobacteraceae bacterium]
HKGGEVASRIAVETISRRIGERLQSGEGKSDPDDLIREAIREADDRIRGLAGADPALQDMGTTLVMALCRGDAIHLAHAGDSRAYRVRNGAMLQLTEDHSLVAEMLKDGELTKEDAVHFRLRHVVTRSLGHGSASDVEQTLAGWQRGDHLLLCSDGLTNMVGDAELHAVIAAGGADVEQACREAIGRANLHGGKDNITAALAYYD